MSRFNREPVPVVIGPCECPGTPHGDGDVVYLAPKISMPGGMAAIQVWRTHMDRATAADLPFDGGAFAYDLGLVWLRHGVVGWNLLDDNGKPAPLTPDNLLAALPWSGGGREVANKADDIYSEEVFVPLAERPSSPSRTGSTSDSTSEPTTSTKTPPASSSPEPSEASTPSTE